MDGLQLLSRNSDLDHGSTMARKRCGQGSRCCIVTALMLRATRGGALNEADAKEGGRQRLLNMNVKAMC